MDPNNIHEEAFVMDGLSAANFTDEYLTETLPGVGLNAVHKTVAGSGDGFRQAVDSTVALRRQLRRLPSVAQAESVDDLRSGGGLQVLFGVQDTTPLEDDPGLLDVFERLGVRIVQLSYNTRNRAANGCTERVDGGLSKFGLEVVDAVEDHDLLLDLSHVGTASAREALDVASQPTVFSHSNPSAVRKHPRNVSDDLIEEAAATGGLVGVNAFPDFVAEDDPTVEDLVDHVEYLCDLVGSEHVALGLDFIDNRAENEPEKMAHLAANPDYPDPPYDYPEGIDSAAEMPNLTVALVERGFEEDAIRGILGENLLRMYEAAGF